MRATHALFIAWLAAGVGVSPSACVMRSQPPEPRPSRDAPVVNAPTHAPPPAAVSDSPAALPAPAAPPAALAPAVIERLLVDGDVPASVVRSRDGTPPRIVFLPGVCSNAGAYLHGFPEAARTHGGAVAIEGDRPCGSSTHFHSITSDQDHERPRIDRALRAAGTDPDIAKVVLIGYSLGATLAENLVRKWPDRYERVVLIGSPRDPQLARLKTARAVVTMSCSLDVPQRMRGAARTLDAAGVAAKYLEMPGCTHGNLADGDRIFHDALAWLEADGR